MGGPKFLCQEDINISFVFIVLNASAVTCVGIYFLRSGLTQATLWLYWDCFLVH